MACASAMIFAKLRGLRYAHTPFSNIAHAPENTPMDEWSAAWESFFALGNGEIPAAEVEARGLRLVEVAKPHRTRLRSRCLHVVAHCHKVTDRHPEEWAALAPVLRQKYLSSPKPVLPPDPDDTIRIAVHLRRGDVGATGRFSERFTPDMEVLRRLAHLLDSLGPARERAVVRLFSEGNPDDFAPYRELGAALHLDEDAFETFHHLARSHVIMLAKSTFSYLAGMIGGALCLYEPFWHQPLPGWLDFETADTMPRDQLARKVLDSAQRNEIS